MTDRTDEELMADYAGGDESALRILVERWERQVVAFLGNVQDAIARLPERQRQAPPIPEG